MAVLITIRQLLAVSFHSIQRSVRFSSLLIRGKHRGMNCYQAVLYSYRRSLPAPYHLKHLLPQRIAAGFKGGFFLRILRFLREF